MEHYVTLFDHAFLPQGLALLASLRRHAGPFTLWVLAMDEVAAGILRTAGPEIRVIPLAEVETAAHLEVKADRTKGEWCWTMTSSCFRAVFDRDATVERVTYLDADVWLLSSPAPLFADFDKSCKDVLITDHHYDPVYDQSATSGRFCVQWLSVKRTDAGLAVVDWWCARCIEWCFNRLEEDRFGDQKYLDRWPELFPSSVHILSLSWAFTAPWNHRILENKRNKKLLPVAIFHHFHGYRWLNKAKTLWWHDYVLGAESRSLYRSYEIEIVSFRNQLELKSFPFVYFSDPWNGRKLGALRRIIASFRGRTGYSP